MRVATKRATQHCGWWRAFLLPRHATASRSAATGATSSFLLPATTLEQAKRVAERLRARVSDGAIAGLDRRVGMSVGIAAFSSDGANGPEWLAAVDRAMYADKNRRRTALERSSPSLDIHVA